MVINFPPTDLSDPLGSHTHSQNGITWEWDGEKWRVTGRPADADLPVGTYVGTFAEVDVDIPTAERQEGQLLWNTDDGILYIWYGPDPGNTRQWVITVPQGSGGGSGSIVVGDSAPSPAETGDLWFNSSSGPGGGTMYVYYGGSWVISVPQPSGPYLSSEKDDSAFGKISFYDGLNVNSGDATFRTTSVHEDGIKLNGGTQTDGKIVGNGNLNKGLTLNETNRITLTQPGGSSGISCVVQDIDKNTTLSRSFAVNSLSTGHTNGGSNNTEYNGIYHSFGADPGSRDVFGITSSVVSTTSFSAAQLVAGFHTDINISDAPNGTAYGFYSSGDAPCYIGGRTFHQRTVEAIGCGFKSYDTHQGPNWGGNQSAKFYATGGSINAIGSQGFTADSIGAGSDGNAIFFFARGSASDNDNNYAFRTSMNTSVGTGNNYAFYASGTARNYFNGNITVSQGTNDDDITTGNSGDVGTTMLAGLHAGRLLSNYQQGNASSAMRYYTRTGSDKGQIMRFFYAATSGSGTSTNCGNIVMTSANSVNFESSPSDYRLKSNVNPMGSAVDAIKALKPYTFEFTNDPGVVHQGFFAHEVQEQVPMAVSGTKDATESIGTLTDWNGKVIETDVVEPDELTYTEEVETDGVTQMVTRTRSWSATGTRDVYQGVDQTKLIPILTKALQEALERIEALEAQINN